MLGPVVAAPAAYAPIADLCVAFKSAGLPEAILPVKNTFINFDGPALAVPATLMRSASCPPCFSEGGGLADAASWESANQVLCHGMVPKRMQQDVMACSVSCHATEACGDVAGMLGEIASTANSEFNTPSSSPRFCSATSQARSTPQPSETGSVEAAECQQVQSTRKSRRRKRAKQHCDQGMSGKSVESEPSYTEAFRTSLNVGIEDDISFGVVRRLVGPNGENLKHIASESQGAVVGVFGKGSRLTGQEANRETGPLRICISAQSQSSFAKASELVKDLIQSTHEDHIFFCSRSGCSKPSS